MSSQLSASLLKLKLLDALRGGDNMKIKAIVEKLNSVESTTQTRDLIQLRETVLHYAVQVAPLSSLEFLIENAEKLKLDINAQDVEGNTPLHLAASSSRKEIVKYLLSLPNINDTIVNRNKQQPVEMCTSIDIIQLMQFERAKFVEQMAHQLREYFTKRDFNNLERILVMNPRASELLDINGADPKTGNTVLHEFILKNDLQMCDWILKHGGDPFKRDKRGKLPIDLVSSKNEPLKKLMKAASKDQTIMDPVATTNHAHKIGCAPTYKGYLRKWTNFASGYKLRYFVLDLNGILSYYASQDDTNNSCRGSLNLGFAMLHLDSSEKLKFEIIGKNGIRWHLKANHPTETNRWVWTLQNAITIAKDSVKKRQAQKSGNLTQNNPQNVTQEDDRKRNRFIPGRRKHRRNLSEISTSSLASNEEEFIPPSGSSTFSKSSPTLPVVPAGNNVGKLLTRLDERKVSGSPSIDNSSVMASDNENYDYDLDEVDGEDYDSDTEAQYELENAENDSNWRLGDQVLSTKRAIEIEILSLLELLETALQAGTSDEADICEVGIKTLSNIKDQFWKYDALALRRDKILTHKLNRQLEVNRLWEQSIRQLEELISKRESQLLEYEEQKKLLKKYLSEGGTVNDLGKGNLLDAQHDSALNKLNASDKQAATEVLESFLNDKSDDEFFDADEFEEEEEEEEQNEQNELEQQEEQNDQEQQEDMDKMSQGQGFKSEHTLIESKGEPSEGAKSSRPEEPELKKTVSSVPGKGIQIETEVFSELQQERLDMINNEGSFLGYENPVRTKLDIDIDDRPRVGLWGILKSMIGKDMTKMTLPVSFNECTSLLQRLAEDIEYSDLLEEASKKDDSTLRMVYVATFATSEYSSTIDRIAKPFNPLLGETFEYCRPDKKYRLIAEQVSHHPPISACNVESVYWDYYGENAVDSKFRGRSFDFKHLGKMFCTIRPRGKVIDQNGNKVDEEVYSWQKVNTSVVGIMLGNPTVDNYGKMHIVNHTTGDSMIVDMKQRGWKASSAYQVSGHCVDKHGKVHWAMGGHWNGKIFAKRVTENDDQKDRRLSLIDADIKSASSDPYSNKRFLVWQAAPRPRVPFNLTSFAVTLNGLDENLKPWLPPTDTRLRPDQRAMEQGKYDLASEEKWRVEDKQRAARKEREFNKIQYRPNWFVKKKHPVTGDNFWDFKGNYWSLRKEKKVSDSGDIF